MEEFKLKLAPEIVSSYRRLSYKVWYALAEFVDNSTQAFNNNSKELKKAYDEEGVQGLTVRIEYHKDGGIGDDYYKITDNSIGMDYDDLRKAFSIGLPPQDTSGRSKYGLGMKTASFWLGDNWSVKTTKLNDDKEYTIALDVKNISGGDLQLDISSISANLKEHYTIIEIKNTHRRFVGRTISKIKKYLASIYRYDIKHKLLDLFWNNEKIEWIDYTKDEFVPDNLGDPYYRECDFEINGKKIYGWAAVLKSGGRDVGGFAILQANRVIQAPPNSYKPSSIFGEQEGGPNDLVNQRIVGEINLNGFEVSHTKDSILWENNEEEEIEDKLKGYFGDLRKVAIEYRSKATDERGPKDSEFVMALKEIENELKSPELLDVISTIEMIPQSVLKESNFQTRTRSEKRSTPTEIKINDLIVRLFVDEKMSPHDPYVINNSTSSDKIVDIFVNKNHPFWNELNGSVGVKNYLRQCVYDGVSEWKAYFKAGNVLPDTIKFIKDNLLRVPFIIEKSRLEPDKEK